MAGRGNSRIPSDGERSIRHGGFPALTEAHRDANSDAKHIEEYGTAFGWGDVRLRRISNRTARGFVVSLASLALKKKFPQKHAYNSGGCSTTKIRRFAALYPK